LYSDLLSPPLEQHLYSDLLSPPLEQHLYSDLLSPPLVRLLVEDDFVDSPHCLCALVVDLAFQTLLRLLDLNRSLLRIRAQRGVDPPAPLL
jgi:hypothetical protein